MLPSPRFAVTGASAQVDRSTCWHTPVVQAREMRAIQKGRAKVKCLLHPDLQTRNERAGRPVYLLAPPGHGDPGRAHKSLVPESGMTKTRNTETNENPKTRKCLKPEKLVSVPPSVRKPYRSTLCFKRNTAWSRRSSGPLLIYLMV